MLPLRLRGLGVLASIAGASATVSALRAQEVFVTELMAVNQGVLDDEDGDSSDWLELFNAGTSALDLDGWYLTDDPGALTKWRLPDVSLPAGGFLVVFASDKDRSDPESELHTNFKLTSGGEYLALVRPDGITVEHAHDPFPPQVAGVSYGLDMDGAEEVLVDLGAPLRWRVPISADDDLAGGANPDSWITPAFDDSGWGSGAGGAGYARAEPDAYDAYIGTDLETQLDGVHPTLYLRFPFEVSSPAAVSSLTLRMRYDDGFAAFLNGEPVPVAAANSPAADALAWNSTASANQPDGDALVPEEWHIGDPNLLPGANVLAVHALNTSSSSSDLLAQPQLVAHGAAGIGGGSGYSTAPSPGAANTLTGEPGPLVRGVPETLPPVDAGDGGAGAVTVADSVAEFSGVQGQDGWSYGYHEGAGAYTPAAFIPFAGGAGSGAWNGGSQQWTGSIWDLQTAGAAPWTSVGAGSVHPNDSDPGPKHATVRRWTSDVSGTHSVTGFFNNGSANGDGTTGRIFHNGAEVFTALTDGDVQNVHLDVDLAVGDTLDFYVDVGPADGDGSDGTNTGFEISEGASGGGQTVELPITAEVSATFAPVAAVTLYHRVMFAAEVAVPMRDDGAAPDALAGDGIYTALISTDQLTPGGMLRWRVVAEDSGGRQTKMPPFPDPNDSPEYFGTIAADASLATSLLPVMHWFAANPGAADTRSGTRGSIYFGGEFYDNIQTDLHGQSTAGFPKKSYDIDFNAGARFRWRDGERRVKDINLLTNWADKAKVRNTLGYALPALAGEPCHFAEPLRVQRNGAFFSTADMVEDGDDRYLDRVGLDGNGALYKMYNTLNSVSGNAKKTRKDEGTTDLQALIDGLGQSGDAKLRYGYDHVDLPGTINYLAALVLINNRDHGHKNYYLYRDTEGSGEWRPLLWDVDLCLGRNWVGGPGYFDDTFTVNALTAGASNRLKTLIYNDPVLWGMFLRRVKTIADEIVQPPGTASPLIDGMVDEVLARIDPPGAVSDADLDFAKWGSWGNGNNAAAAAARIKSEFLPAFRTHFFSDLAATLPSSQPPSPPMDLVMGEFNPASGDQLEEYFLVTNPNGYAVDLSGWRVDGGVRLDLPAGTVVPAGGTLYLGRDAVAFRGRATSPTGNEKRYLVGGYGGQLSARGETITLADPAGSVVDSLTYPGAPTPAQQWLRVTELHFHPADPTPAELALVPGATASDFEFVELTNTGAAALDLSGVRFVDGIDFRFPDGASLAGGASVLVVANPAAFEARYGAGLNVAGAFGGSLANGGEAVQLLDGVGENVLEFAFDDTWYPPADGAGYSLQIRDPAAAFETWSDPFAWAPSCLPGGSPGSVGGPHGLTFSIWKEAHFTVAEAADPLVSGPATDGDRDTRPAQLEYALAADPGTADADRAPEQIVLEEGGELYYALRFERPRHAADLSYALEVSSTLEGWVPAPATATAIDHGDGTETVTLREDAPVGGAAPRRFLRLRVDLAE